jgi:CheY-like chemotaxis protein
MGEAHERFGSMLLANAIAPLSSSPVLVVEDDNHLRAAMLRVLAHAGFSAIGVSNGNEALDYLAVGRPPLAILLDLQLPLMDGATLRWVLLSEPRWAMIPVVVCSADLDAVESRSLPGIERWLGKPFSPAVLVDAVRPYHLLS